MMKINMHLIDSIQERRDIKKSRIPILLKISPDIDDKKLAICVIFSLKKKLME